MKSSNRVLQNKMREVDVEQLVLQAVVLVCSTAVMNFLKRATTSIFRRPGKTIILMLLVFILSVVVSGAISVEGAFRNTDANLRRNMQPLVSIQEDWEAFNNSWNPNDDFDWNSVEWDDPSTHPPQNERLLPEHIRAIGALTDYISFYDYIIGSGMQSFEFVQYEIREGMFWREEGEPMWHNFQGTSTTNMVQIEEGIIRIIQGRPFEQEHLNPGGDRPAALISMQFAHANNLAVGSTMQMYEIIRVPEENQAGWWGGPGFWDEENIYTRVTVDFEIIGIFEMDPMSDDIAEWSQEEHDFVRSLNTIYTPNWVLEDLMRRRRDAELSAWENVDFETPQWIINQGNEDDEEFQMWITPLFVIRDPEMMDDFVEAAMPLLPNEFWTFIDRSGAFDSVASSMASIQTIANVILWVSVGATVAILSLLITLFLRDRRFEMGVYLALGEKRGKIITQILLEVVVTSFIAITASFFVGSIISSSISRNMLVNELQGQADATDEWGNSWRQEWTVFDQLGIPSNDLSPEEMMELFDVSLDGQTIILFYGIGLGAVILSTLAPVFYIVTLNPKKVLM